MKKLLLSLSLTSIILAQNPNQSISARLAGGKVAQQATSNAKIKNMVDCVCENLFPALQEVLSENKADVKELIKLMIASQHLNKAQLNVIKAELQQAQPLLVEGVRVYAVLLKQCGPDVSNLGKKVIERAIKAGENFQGLFDDSLAGELEEILAKATDNEKLMQQLDQFHNEKLAAFADAWRKENEEIGQAIVRASMITEEQAKDEAFIQAKKNEMVELAQKLMDGVQNLLIKALSNKRAMKLQAEIMPFIQHTKNNQDVLRLAYASASQLDAQVIPLLDSAEKFALFAVPFLVPVITQAIDELVQTMPE